ncbi:hypothetical protein LIX60_17455 [Streptomyces sp. S07_1.15]|uniref:hypothetical protein n=1 Tax=Streptomyces sp. S07_1.15 TaxID=2873925 RepID=UPI001D1331B5|nr:hypothetical protein [Streptomyces sp. S07_1.15]MCC3653216.1 hypothetical protein [Streptomyces sp. S07_1.15]
MSTGNEKAPRLRAQTGGRNDHLAGGSPHIVPQQDLPRVPGRIEVYRGHRGWHRQVHVDPCPGCGMPHLHRVPQKKPATMRRAAPCGAAYVVELLPGAVA